MPAERVSMRRVREILRLKFECGRSDRAIAVAVSVARSTVQLCLARFAAAGLSRGSTRPTVTWCQCRLNFPQECRLNFPHFVDWPI